MSQSVWDQLKTKRKSEWAEWAKGKITDLRIWMQENGEAALAVGVLIGVCFVLFFKLFIGLLVVGGLLGLIIWQFAPEEEAEAKAVKTEDAAETVSMNGNPESSESVDEDTHIN